MSILIGEHIDALKDTSIDSDITQMLELSAGQYKFDEGYGDITDISSGVLLYVNGNMLNVNRSWLNSFIIAPMTRVVLYSVDQSNPDLRYTGDMLIVSNYSIKHNGHTIVDLSQTAEGRYMIDDITYVVIISLDRSTCRKQQHDGILQMKYIPASKHTKRLSYEPIIATHRVVINRSPIVMLIVILLCCITFSLLTYVILHKAHTKGIHNIIGRSVSN